MKALIFWLLFDQAKSDAKSEKKLNRKLIYSAKTLKSTNPYSFNKEGIPLGKNIKLVYDSFFKKYDLTYTNIDNERVKETIKFCDGCTKNNTNELLYNNITDEIKSKKRITIHLVGDKIYIFDGIVLLK